MSYASQKHRGAILDYEYGDPMENNQLFVAVAWYISVGVVCTFDKFERKYQTHINALSPGNKIGADIQQISNYGSKFPLEAFMILAPHIDYRLDVYEETLEKQI